MIDGELIFLVVVVGLVVARVGWGLFFTPDTKIHRRLFARRIAGEEVTVLGVALPGDETCRLALGAPPNGHVLVTDEPTTVHSVARGAG